MLFVLQMCQVVPPCTTTTRATQTLRIAVMVTLLPVPKLLLLFWKRKHHCIEAPCQKCSAVRIGCVPYPPFLSLVKLWSLANRRRVSMSPLANQQHAHVSIGSSFRPHPCLKNPRVNTNVERKKSPPVPCKIEKQSVPSELHYSKQFKFFLHNNVWGLGESLRL